MLYPKLREEVCILNKMLPQEGLVAWTGGNVSAIHRDAGHVVIKPSGVLFAELTPESLVVVDMEGNVVDGSLKPSVDTDIHRYIYQKRPDVGGICHTHQPYATSFAARGERIPAILTPLAHLIGSDVPCTRYATPGYVDTGEAIFETIGHDGYAVLVKQHGVFTMGESATFATKVAVYLEEAAKTVHLAMLRGPVEELPPEEIERSFNFYKTEYGQ